MKSFTALCFTFLFGHVCDCKTFSLRQADKESASQAFMIVSGITSSSELCLVLENSNVVLEDCLAALAAGDGRELFTFTPNGRLQNVGNNKCVSLQNNEAVAADCDAAGSDAFEVTGNGQLKAGQNCLSQSGLAPGRKNAAAKTAVAASSTIDAIAHGAAMAVDGNAASYWASKLDDIKEPVTFSIDLGETEILDSIDIDFEFPAKSFAVSLSTDGTHFVESFSTDVNVLKTTRIPLGGKLASKAKLVMHAPHPVYGKFEGHALYGIKSISLNAQQMKTVVDECAKAAKSSDARDKYFLSYVKEFDPYPAKSLRSEVPLLESAQASLAATASDLSDALPKLALCRTGAGFISNTSFARIHASRAQGTSGNPLGDSISAKNGIDVEGTQQLIMEARLAIMAARKVLM